MFGAAGVEVEITDEQLDLPFASPEQAVHRYTEHFGPFVALRAIIEPQGRWVEFLAGFGDLVGRFARPRDGGIVVGAGYLLITASP